ncbi:hypothetical protein BKA69DRAFT_235424 [Paraphysoderma sedebokerense]|nr:hypothetical protein BKA69DRAFT_235424 [Paraphysoderma sedebokerense]
MNRFILNSTKAGQRLSSNLSPSNTPRSSFNSQMSSKESPTASSSTLSLPSISNIFQMIGDTASSNTEIKSSHSSPNMPQGLIDLHRSPGTTQCPPPLTSLSPTNETQDFANPPLKLVPSPIWPHRRSVKGINDSFVSVLSSRPSESLNSSGYQYAHENNNFRQNFDSSIITRTARSSPYTIPEHYQSRQIHSPDSYLASSGYYSSNNSTLSSEPTNLPPFHFPDEEIYEERQPKLG